MPEKEIIADIKKYIEDQRQSSNFYREISTKSDLKRFITSHEIHVALNSHKEIILQEETGLELGGMGNTSYSLIYPTNESIEIHDGTIMVLGPEINQLSQSSVDFALIIFIKGKNLTRKMRSHLKHLSFISDGIEGFSIRSIPQRLWCRLTKNILKRNFSFEFLAKAFLYLYEERYGSWIEKIEIILINSLPELIERIKTMGMKLDKLERLRWKEKINEWKKRLDCDYNWDCITCPYTETCEELRKIIRLRNEIEP
ncbi:MAG: hypothetical protein ACTSU4_05890 [Promethearchaeota archaeon]